MQHKNCFDKAKLGFSFRVVGQKNTHARSVIRAIDSDPRWDKSLSEEGEAKSILDFSGHLKVGKKCAVPWPNFQIFLEHRARQEMVALRHLVTKGHGFADVTEVAINVADAFKKTMFRLKAYCPVPYQRTQLFYGSGIVNHEMVFWPKVELRVQFEEEGMVFFNYFFQVCSGWSCKSGGKCYFHYGKQLKQKFPLLAILRDQMSEKEGQHPKQAPHLRSRLTHGTISISEVMFTND